VQVFIVTQFPESGRFFAVDERLFGQFLNGQIFPALLIATFAGAGLVANDLRTGAILAYLSRPLTRRDYFFGKLGVVLALTLSVTAVAGLVLYSIAVAMAPERFLHPALWWLAPAIVLHGGTISLVLSLVILAISSLSRSGRVAGLAFFGLFVGLEITNNVIRAIYETRAATVLSLPADLRSLGSALFGVAARRFEAVPWQAAVAALVAVSFVCVLIVRSRVRAVEIVT
jgi:ABC-type transport system involved in multi-copper enzyme maturation permease subunit